MGFIADLRSVQHIAAWAYGQGVESGALAWLAVQRTELLTRRCLGCFPAKLA